MADTQTSGPEPVFLIACPVPGGTNTIAPPADRALFTAEQHPAPAADDDVHLLLGHG